MSEKLTCYIYIYIMYERKRHAKNLSQWGISRPFGRMLCWSGYIRKGQWMRSYGHNPWGAHPLAKPTYYVLSKTITDFPAIKKHMVPPLAGMFSLLHLETPAHHWNPDQKSPPPWNCHSRRLSHTRLDPIKADRTCPAVNWLCLISSLELWTPWE